MLTSLSLGISGAAACYCKGVVIYMHAQCRYTCMIHIRLTCIYAQICVAYVCIYTHAVYVCVCVYVAGSTAYPEDIVL